MKIPNVQSCLGPNIYPEVPDGGWGWAVALAFFLVEVCTYGVIKSLGVFLQDLMEEFGESNSRVSWVISICVFVFAFSAPLSTMLSNRFGYRPVVMMGGFLISLGTITSAFTSSVTEMYITTGIVAAAAVANPSHHKQPTIFEQRSLGYCLSFLPTITILAQYFSRRRALVTSMASSGESVAMFVFAPAFTTLKEHIGWRFCLVILGIIQASVIGGGVLLRPIVIEPEPLKKNDDEMLSMKEMEAVYELENEQTRTSISSDISQGSQDSGVTSLSASNVDLRNAEGETKALMEWKDKVPDKDGEDISLSMPSVQVSEDKGELAEIDGGPVRSTGSKLLDFSVLKDPGFICYSLFGLFATLGFFAPQLYIIELSKSRGVESTMASYMLSVMAVADILGRLFIGVVLNKVRFRKTLVLLGCVVLMSLVLVAFTIVWEFWGLAICSGFFGFIMGTVASTHIPMLAEEDVVGIEKMPSSVGVYVFIQSFAGLAGPPLGGMLVDITDNYGAAFYSCAAGTGLSAICLALVGPAKSKACQRVSRVQENAEEVKISQNSDQSDFLEVDLAPEDSPVGQGEDQDSCVI